MIFTAPPELTTSITDLLLGLLSFYFYLRLQKSKKPKAILRTLWSGIFGIMTIVSIYGAVLHGIIIEDKILEMLWHPLTFLLGLMTSLFVSTIMTQWKGVKVLKMSLSILIAISLIFFILFLILTPYVKHSFAIFIGYSGIMMLLSLIISLYLFTVKKQISAAWFSAGIINMIIASGLQAIRMEVFTIIWEFDHNSIYHIVMMFALFLFYIGCKKLPLKEEIITNK